MNCVIPGSNLKVLSRMIMTLSKIGDDVFLEAKPDCLCLKSVNMATTAYCTITLYDIFFVTYEPSTTTSATCRLPMKAMLGTFKSFCYRDKKVDFCKMELEENATKIVVKFRHKHDVTVVRSLYLTEGHTVNIVHDADRCVNRIGGSAQVFAQVLANFQTNDEDVSIETSMTKATFRNYTLGDTTSKAIRSQITLTAGEFASYAVDADSTITFSSRPFRAAASFAEAHSLPIALNFEKSGRPVVLVVKSPTFEMRFVMSTLRGDDSSQSTLSSMNFNEPMEQEDVVQRSPESPRSKRIKSVFARCCETTFNRDDVNLGRVLADDSDPDSDC